MTDSQVTTLDADESTPVEKELYEALSRLLDNPGGAEARAIAMHLLDRLRPLMAER